MLYRDQTRNNTDCLSPAAPPRPRCPSWLFSLLLVGLMGCGSSCGGCDSTSEETSALEEQPLIPTHPTELSLVYAEKFPVNTQAFALTRGFEGVAEMFQNLQPFLLPLLDLNILEGEFRNTFGLDLQRPETFDEFGIFYSGGCALAMLGEQPVISFFIQSPEALIENVSEILRRQPFNYRAPVIEEQLGESTVYRFSRRTNQPTEIALLIKEEGTHAHGFLIYRVRSRLDVMDTAVLLSEITPESSLAQNPKLTAQLDRFESFPFVLYLDTTASSETYLEQYGDRLTRAQRFSLEQTASSVESVCVGLHSDESAMNFQSYVAVGPEVVEISQGIDQTSGEDPEFGQLLLENAYLGARLGVNPNTFLETFLWFQGEHNAGQIREILRPLETSMGHTVDELAALLGGDMMVLLSRISPIGIMRANSPGDFIDALGLLFVAHLNDPAAMGSALDQLVAAAPDTFSKVTDEQFVIYSSLDPRLHFGNLLIYQDLMFLVPERILRTLRTVLSEEAEAALTEDTIVELVSTPGSSGLFLRFAPLIPISTLLNWPHMVRDLLGLLDHTITLASVDGEGLLLDGSLIFSSPVAE